MKRFDKQKQKKAAQQHIIELFDLAKEVFPKNRSLAKRYVSIARKLAMRLRSRLPSTLKRRFCKTCGAYLVPGTNLRVRTVKGKVVYYCLECKHFMRFPYTREKKGMKSLP